MWLVGIEDEVMVLDHLDIKFELKCICFEGTQPKNSIAEFVFSRNFKLGFVNFLPWYFALFPSKQEVNAF